VDVDPGNAICGGDKADKPVLNKNAPSKPMDRITMLKAKKLGSACRLTGSYVDNQ
jgi:hypothetical protein